jgi:regulatory protein
MGFGKLSLKGRALRYLAAREHSRQELERKLEAFEEEPGQVAAVLDDLQAKGFISAHRVAESVIHRRSAKVGSARIRQELQAKGLDQDTVATALASLKTTELVRAKEVWRKKFGEPPADASERGRQMRFLAARGFDAEMVRKVVAAAGDDDL